MGHVSGGLSVHPGSNVLLADIGRASSLRDSTSVAVVTGRAPNISDIGRKGSVDSSSGTLTAPPTVGLMGLPGMAPGGTLRRLHSYPSSSDTDTSPPIARLQPLRHHVARNPEAEIMAVPSTIVLLRRSLTSD